MIMRAPAHGFTLVELLLVVVITIILLGMAAPSFVGTFARLRMEGMVNELSVDLQYARSASIRWQAPVSLVTADDGTLYTIRRGDLILKSVALPAGTTVTGAVTVAFEPLRGIANAAQLDIMNVLVTPRLRASTNAMGRVQLCSPSGEFAGYAAC
jgi:type IV fimbrial biogenesis protein FimT